jgi:hypothetical protein
LAVIPVTVFLFLVTVKVGEFCCYYVVLVVISATVVVGVVFTLHCKLLESIHMNCDMMTQLLIRYSARVRYWYKHKSPIGQHISSYRLQESLNPMIQLGKKYCTISSMNLVYTGE